MTLKEAMPGLRLRALKMESKVLASSNGNWTIEKNDFQF